MQLICYLRSNFGMSTGVPRPSVEVMLTGRVCNNQEILEDVSPRKTWILRSRSRDERKQDPRTTLNLEM